MRTNFNEVPDTPQTILTFSPAPTGSVDAHLVTQFMRNNHIRSGLEILCKNQLSRIPADNWPIISTFLSRTCQNKIDNILIDTLSEISSDQLPLVINFAARNNLSDYEMIRAL
jgi:hypothetical protein